MDKCDFCLYRDDCIGEIPGPDGLCVCFGVPSELLAAYEDYLEKVDLPPRGENK